MQTVEVSWSVLSLHPISHNLVCRRLREKAAPAFRTSHTGLKPANPPPQLHLRRFIFHQASTAHQGSAQIPHDILIPNIHLLQPRIHHLRFPCIGRRRRLPRLPLTILDKLLAQTQTMIRSADMRRHRVRALRLRRQRRELLGLGFCERAGGRGAVEAQDDGAGVG